MARPSRKSNPVLHRTVSSLRQVSREHGSAVWRTLAERLEGSRRNWAEVNLSRVARHAKPNETLAIPGVLLAAGTVTFPVRIAAFRASATARQKVEAAGGHVLDLPALAGQVPKGTGVRILG